MAFTKIPGDPGAIESAAGKLKSLSHGVGTSGDQITSVAGSVLGGWQGQAASNFEAVSGRVAAGHRDAGDLLSKVGAALSTFAGKLSDAQAKQRHAESMANTAIADAGAAMARLAVTYSVAEVDVIAGNVPPHLSADIAGAKRSIDGALSTATAAAQQLQQQAEEEYHAALAVLRQALGDGLAAAHTLENGVVAIGNAIGMPSTVWTGVSTLFFFRSLERWGTLGKEIPGSIARAFDESIGPLALAADRGELSWAEVDAAYARFAKNAELASGAFRQGANAELAAGGLDLGKVFGVGLGGVALVGDAATIIAPPDTGAAGWVDRGMAGANAVGTGIGIAATLGVIDASTGWIPIAGQVIVIGTGLYLAGDWLYNNVTPFRDAMNDTGRFIANTAVAGYHDAAALVNDGLNTADHVVDTAGNIASAGWHDATSFASGAANTVSSGLNAVGNFLGL